MPSARRFLALVVLTWTPRLVAQNASASAATSGPPLRVIRAGPTGDANPLSQITVTFDRPVAGSLDRVVDPATVFRVEPTIAGKLEWRDPVTVRLIPAAPLTTGMSYTVTVSNGFRSMDGGALAEPYRFSFRAQGATLTDGAPLAPNRGRVDQLTLDQHFELVYSAPADLAALTSTAYIELNAACAADRIVKLRATSQRRIPTRPANFDDDEGGRPSNPALDSLRRAVTLVPESPLPRSCSGDLVAPLEIGETSKGYARMPFATYGDFRISILECNRDQPCPRGPLHLRFTTPVLGKDLLRSVRVIPDAKIVIRDTESVSTVWTIEGSYKPRTGYAVSLDTALRDTFGQRLLGNPAAGYRTTGVPPLISYQYGRLVVERRGFKTLSVQSVNVDTLVALVAPIPDSLESSMSSRFGWAKDSIWQTILHDAKERRIPVHSSQDRAIHTGVAIPASDARRPGSPTLYAVKITGRAGAEDVRTDAPVAIVQVTNLGVHARIGAADGAVWVTGANDGLPRAGATVVLYDDRGHALASSRTDATGLARLAGWSTPAPRDTTRRRGEADNRYVKVTLGDDRAIGFVSAYDPDLSPWRFNISGAWGEDRLPVAGAVFTERGIYRPGERVYAKAIVRDGLLGALHVPVPGDSLRWRFQDRDGAPVQQATVPLTSFGTSTRSFLLPTIAPVGQYSVGIQMRREGRWQNVGYASYRVAEYRPPEFLVTTTGAVGTHFPGDTFSVTVQSRYLFGAPMGRAAVGWLARVTNVSPWDLEIPGTDGWYVGQSANWWEEDRSGSDSQFATGIDTLDARGERTLRVVLPPLTTGRAATVTVSTVVTDVNRQNVLASASTLVHPADFYIAVKPRSENYFWKAGTPQTVDVVAVRPTGERVSGARVQATVVRREWHQVRRERDGISELVGDWVSDTVATCSVVTTPTPQSCAFTPTGGGEYTVSFSTTDSKGRAVSSSFGRWASGTDWVPWNDETQFKMDVIPDKKRYSVGDTATVLFASPFTNAEAWITVEREGIIDQRRIRITSGSTTLKLPITEAFAPNAFVSILVARGRSAAPGPLDDPGRPTIRVGYANLRVTPEVKRLALTLTANKQEYRPGDTARVRIQVRDAKKKGARSEVTLWAVDEGVLSLTAYKTPDPIDLVYRERGLGVRLASNMTTVAPQVPDGMKGREPGGGGGAAGADVLRSRFQTTAFFIGSVVTDEQGNGVAQAKLPDNLTTFRLMAVAVTANDRYGKGESSLLVTRPLLARQALPRFVRPGDQFTAGAVINRRDGTAATVDVRASSVGVTLKGDADRRVTLAASRGAEVRFPFLATRVDSAAFRFDVSGDGYADAVRVALPVRPEYHPRVHALAGVLRDTATVELALPAGIDPDRSRLSVNVGVSPLPMIRGMAETLHIYPYYCSEQVISTAMPLIALYRAQRQTGMHLLKADPRSDITRAVEMLSRRQRSDGGIGYWSATDWSSAWLSAYAGIVLLDARDAGVKVDTAVLSRLARYVETDFHATIIRVSSPIARWQDNRQIRLRDQVAAVDFLSRFGRPDVAAENELLRTASLLTLEDRARLAEVLVRRKQVAAARSLMAPTWNVVKVEGRRATIPDSAHVAFYFESEIRPIARLLTATLAVDPSHALIGPLVETLVLQARAQRDWNTQDYGSAILALAAFDAMRRGQPERTVRLRLRDNTAITVGAARDSSVALTGLLADAAGGRVLRATLDAGPGDGAVYYYLAVTEIPSKPPVTPENAGIAVERWYERYETGAPVTTVAEGDLVRVRLRITVPSLRQFVILDDALPAGLEAIDLSLRTASALPGPGTAMRAEDADHEEPDDTAPPTWGYGSWDAGWWSPFDHRELRDDRVVYSATVLWPGTYTATYLARATTPGTFIKPPAHAEEMYNPGLNGRSDGGTFVVTARGGK
jgi:uncharacterized protein YfaS (alpha-2-macroglobulin family)